MSIRVKKITYAPADVYAMGAAPQKVLDAPASGYVNNILGVSHDMTYATTQYVVATELRYGNTNNNATRVFVDAVVLGSAFNCNLPAVQQTTPARVPFSTTKDFYVTTNGNAILGDSPIDAYIIYEEKLLDT